MTLEETTEYNNKKLQKDIDKCSWRNNYGI